jgi:hypothetical protein
VLNHRSGFGVFSPTLYVETTEILSPRLTWSKTFVFLHSLTMHQRCVVLCTLTTGTPKITTVRRWRDATIALYALGKSPLLASHKRQECYSQRGAVSALLITCACRRAAQRMREAHLRHGATAVGVSMATTSAVPSGSACVTASLHAC